MTLNKKDTFLKLNKHKRIAKQDVEVSNEIDDLTKEEVNRIVTKVQRKQSAK